MMIADLAENGIKASRADIIRALVMTNLDHAVDITREHLGHDSEYS